MYCSVSSLLFVAILWVLAATPTTLAGEPGEPSANLSFKWIDRAMEFAKRSEDAKTISNVFVYRAVWHARHKSYDAAVRDTTRCSAPPLVTIELARLGDDKGALQIARALPPSRAKQQAFCGIVHALSKARKFDRAISVIGEIDDPTVCAWARLGLTLQQANAGCYDAASKTLASMQTPDAPSSSSTLARRQEECARLIERCRVEEYTRPPSRPFRSVADRFRELTVHWDVNYNRLSESERLAKTLTNPIHRVKAWLAIAWAYLERRELQACNTAKERALQCADEMANPETAALGYIFLADLQLELGEGRSAKKLVRRAIQATGRTWTAKTLASPVGPETFGVLTRCGEAQVAIDALLSIRGQTENSLWLAVGAFTWSEGKKASLDGLLESDIPDAAKATICLGAVQAIQAIELTEED